MHALPHYITTMASGYLIGNPVQYSGKDGDTTLDEIMTLYRAANTQAVDSELAEKASIFGRAVELLYSNEEAKARTASLDPLQAFVVYDDTVENRPLFGVYFYPRLKIDGTADGYMTHIYTDAAEHIYVVSDIANQGNRALEAAKKHYFGGVPTIEYWNCADERGDFERVLSLIDAYDNLQSDRVNDKQQFVDALLLLYGCTLEPDAAGRLPGQQLREDKVLALPDSEARAEYLSKSLDESQTETLRDALKSDIHKLSMVPDLTDEQFAGNSSGVAMKYKLLGLEQLTKIKERWFREALRERLRLFAHFTAVKGSHALDMDSVQITFTRALPVNEPEIAGMVSTLQGLVPDEILLTQIPFVSDPKKALKALAEQKEQGAKRQRKVFDAREYDEPDAPDEVDEDDDA